MTRHHPAGSNVELRPVEWVRHLPDQAMHRVARQPRIAVERYDVTDAGGYFWRLPTKGQKAGIGCATQQPVQFVQLAALAFPADPLCFPDIPEPLAVKQQEAVATRRRTVVLIEPCNAGDCRFQQYFVAVGMLCRGIEPIGEK